MRFIGSTMAVAEVEIEDTPKVPISPVDSGSYLGRSLKRWDRPGTGSYCYGA